MRVDFKILKSSDHQGGTERPMTKNETERPVRVALYVRQLTGAPKDSWWTQLDALRMQTRKDGKEVVRVYFEALGSRAQFMRMTAEAMSLEPPFDLILGTNSGYPLASERGLLGWKTVLESHGVSVGFTEERARDGKVNGIAASQGRRLRRPERVPLPHPEQDRSCCYPS